METLEQRSTQETPAKSAEATFSAPSDNSTQEASADGVSSRNHPTDQESFADESQPKLDINFLSLDGQPINKMMVQVSWDGGELLAHTNSEGYLPPVEAPPGAQLNLAVRRFDGTYKAIGHCVMPATDGLLTGVSPNTVFDCRTEQHAGAPGDAKQKIPQAQPADLGDLNKATEAAADSSSPPPAASPSSASSGENTPSQKNTTSKPVAPKKPETKATQQALKPPQNISGKQPEKPALEKGRTEEGNPFAYISKKVTDWWNSWRMPTLNLWGGDDNKGKGTAPATPVAFNAEMIKRVETLLAFAKEQTSYSFQGTANALASMSDGTFKPGKKETWISLGRCYTYVKVALTRCKIIDGILAAKKISLQQSDDEHYAMQDSAGKAGPALLAKGFIDVTGAVPDARWAAAGDIIVYEWSPQTWEKRKKKYNNPNYPNHGHIDIRDYETYISDFMPEPTKMRMHPRWSDYQNVHIYRKDFDLLPTLRIMAFLRCIREFECQAEHNDATRYQMLNTALPNTGSKRFSSFATHPWANIPKAQWPKSTAAGAYQILCSTWKDIFDTGFMEQLPNGTASFTPRIQDRMAVIRLEYRKALHLIRTGKLEDAIQETDLVNEWTSLPGGKENAKRLTADKKPMDMAYLKSLFEQYLTEEKRKAGL